MINSEVFLSGCITRALIHTPGKHFGTKHKVEEVKPRLWGEKVAERADRHPSRPTTRSSKPADLRSSGCSTSLR